MRTFRLFISTALAGAGFISGTVWAQSQTYTCAAPGGFAPLPAAAGVPPILLSSLKTVANPVLPNGALRGDLADYIKDAAAAIRLGKALFWDMQAGSDNKTACATCHSHAGADGRTKNQLHPGPNGAFQACSGPNCDLASLPNVPMFSPASDDLVGSQGVRKSTFQGFDRKTGAELITPVADPVFNAGGANVRQVTGMNTPSVINAVFNHRNFFNGRAQAEFNGIDPFGNRNGSARVWMLGATGVPVQMDIHIQNASLASQAVGPPLNTVEMSAAGRTFADLGRKLLNAKPLALQRVNPGDSVLGALADTATGKGLKIATYSAMIQAAFQPKWWNYTKKMPAGGYSMMEANFSLYWGLAIMLYEATLVSDASPMDQYLLTRVFKTDPATGLLVLDPATGLPILLSDDKTRLNPVVARLAAEGVTKSDGSPVTVSDILQGLALFEMPAAPPPSFPAPPGFGVGCIGCHMGPETTSASLSNLVGHGQEAGDTAFKAAGFDLRMERMFMKLDWTPPGPLSPVPQGADTITFDPNTYAVNVVRIAGNSVAPIALRAATYDAGWYNLGVRPTADDRGLGAVDPFGKPLSWTQLLQQTLGDPSAVKVPGNGLPCAGAGNAAFPNLLLNASGFPLLSGPLRRTEPVDVDGSFKVSGLRNVELHGPYFHNGGKSTLMQVMEFYDHGGDFSNPTKAPAMVPLQLTAQQMNSIVSFLLSLTDERVRWQKAPFDHPQLFIPNGDNPAGTDSMVEVPAVGAAGASTALRRFLGLNPFALF